MYPSASDADPIKIELVVRGYLAGQVPGGNTNPVKRMICGEVVPDGLKESDRF